MQELAVAVEERAHDRDPRGNEHERVEKSTNRFLRRDVDQADPPGLHCECLSAAQPGPEEVGGEEGDEEDLQRVAAPAGDVERADEELEEPGAEEGDREKQ